MERAANKAARLLQIEALLLDFKDGLSQSDIARKIHVNRSTITRYLPDMERFFVYQKEDKRLAIDHDHYLTNVRLTMHECMALHLAARLMATRTDKQNPNAAAALRKLGLAMEKISLRIANHLKASADVMDNQAQRYDPVYLQVLETLTSAWSSGKMVHVWHQMEDGRVFEYKFAPYFIEPHAIGQTTHVIGYRDPPKALRTFKIERIQRVEMLNKSYTIPDDFDPRVLLSNTWGIWYTETEPIEVVLKFHPRVTRRVKETQWHWLEKVKPQADGSLIWRIEIAEPLEMIPWIRSWGPNVQVLAPESLRNRMIKELKKTMEVYMKS